MKKLNYIFSLLVMAFIFTSCSNDDNPIDNTDDVTKNLHKVQEILANGHTIELYNDSPNFIVGYNDIHIKIKDANGKYLENFSVDSWMPKMYMEAHTHACPFSDVKNTKSSSVKKGYIVFIMASNDTEYWKLDLNYKADGKEYTASEKVVVKNLDKGRRQVMGFDGSDGTKYFVAYVAPRKPEVSINDVKALIFKKENMMKFPLVENYSMTLDPRMPSMDNHSSPNNEDFKYNSKDKVYEGKLSLSMTGYWKLNLKVMNTTGELIAGTDVTEENESSTVYLEIEF